MVTACSLGTILNFFQISLIACNFRIWGLIKMKLLFLVGFVHCFVDNPLVRFCFSMAFTLFLKNACFKSA